MKAILSSTYDDKYLWNLPLVTWCWNKLGIDVICFMPISRNPYECYNGDLALKTMIENGMKYNMQWFLSTEDKESTYAQCSRLYAACLALPEDEILVTSDVDMIAFKKLPYNEEWFTVFGSDLVPKNQFPICYLSAPVKEWENRFDINSRTYQGCLDDLLGDIEAEHFRGNYWGKDQEEAYKKIGNKETILINRAREGTQFASNRYDRDDSYLLDRLSLDTIDFHLPRPGYEEKNFNIIMQVLKFHFPNENFQWLIDYNEQYKKLL